jgi:hypothetical protein
VAAIQEPMRSVADFPTYTPAWVLSFIRRLAKLERGRAHEITLILPENGADPYWVIKGSAKVEGNS